MATGLHDCRRLKADEDLDSRYEVCSLQLFQDGEHRDFGDFMCNVFIEKNTNIVKWIQINHLTTTVSPNDRVVLERSIFVVEEVVDGNALKVCFDSLESSLLKFQDMGVSIEKGIKVPVNQVLSTEDVHFVDQWCGVWTRNICENYQLLKKGKSIKDLKDVCKDKPAVIVGAGPSLDKNIDELKDINALIIATDRAYKPLLARGIEPDLVVSVDCHDDLILGYLDKVDSSKHTLVLNAAADYQIAKIWKGRILYFNMGHAGMQFCDRVLPYLFSHFMAIANVGCVVNTALIVAHWIGCKDLILAGCDFSYPGQKMSCDKYDWVDGAFQKIEVDELARFVKRSGKIQKNGIYTYPPFMDYEKTMKVLAETQDYNIINATEGGIIDKFPIMTLKEAKQKYCQFGVEVARLNLKQED